MFMDQSLELADATSIILGTGTNLVGNVLDLQQANQQVGNEGLYLVITVDTAILAAGAGTLEFALATDGAVAVSSSSKTLLRTGAFTTASTGSNLPAGSVLFVCEIPAALLNSANNDFRYKRYLGLLAIVTTQAITAGKINAFLVNDASSWIATPAAI